MTVTRETDFRCTLGPWSAGAIVAGSMIGTGIFLFASEVAQHCRDGRMIMLIWAVGALIAVCGGLCLAELAAAYPKTGGTYVFLHMAFGPLVSFLYVWCKFFIMRVGSFAIPACFFAEYFCVSVGLSGAGWRTTTALAVIILLTVVNAVGVQAASAVQNVFTAAKIAALAAIVGVALVYWATPLPPRPVPDIPAVIEPDGSWLVLLGTAFIAVMWTYGGWDESPFVAEEVRDPGRNLPRSIIGGLFVVTVLYLLVNLAYLTILSPDEIGVSSGQTAIWAMHRALGPWAGKVLSVVLMISTFGAANGMALTGARIAYAAGCNQPLGRWFAWTHSKTKAPVHALIVQAALACAAILLIREPFYLLLFTGLAYWLFSGLMAGAVIVLRQRDQRTRRPFRVWAYPFTPILFILASMGMAASVVYQTPGYALVTAYVLLSGIGVFFLQRLWSGQVGPVVS